MESGTVGDSNGDLNSRVSFPWTEDKKVYTRRLRKKAPKRNNNNDNATPTASAVHNSTPEASAAATTSENPSTSTAEVSNASASEGPNGNQGEDVSQEPLKAIVTKNADSSHQSPKERSPCQERSPSDRSADKDSDSSLHNQQLREERQGHNKLSRPDNICSLQNRQQDSECENAEKQSSLGKSNEVQNFRKQSTLEAATELPRTCFDKREQNYQRNGGEVAAAGRWTGSELEIGGEFTQVPLQIYIGNEPANNEHTVVKPLVRTQVDDRVRFLLFRETPKNEIEELRKKFEHELDQTQLLYEQLEAKERRLSFYYTPFSISDYSNGRSYIAAKSRNIGVYGNMQAQQALIEDVVDNMPLMRMNSEVGVVGHPESRPIVFARMNSDMGAARNLESRPYHRQLSVAVMENNHREGEFVEKEKRTPKANQYYRNSEFLLGKDRLPPASTKRIKTNNGRKHNLGTEQALGFRFGFHKSRNRLFKSCSSVLQRLMKHKHGWVFNEPVNAKALGLLDYHNIIKHPMDLGTIKTRLSQHRYKSPSEFSEDVKLVFRNAMTYNSKGQDVHVMAKQLLQIFEERWAIIETKYNPYWKYQMYDAGLPTPTSRNIAPQSQFVLSPIPVPASVPGFVQPMGILARQETMQTHVSVDSKLQQPHISRTIVPKKPKARDPNKRDMTNDEKLRLSTNLQGLPAEKLDSIVQIVKKRNTALSQHDDEIEVDIDNVDAETLWELDRLVINYKKSLSKNKRKAELAHQARKATTNQIVAPTSTTGAVAGAHNGSEAFEKSSAPPALDGEKESFNGTRSSSSSSSSSDSGSTSSDSDSDSSSDSDAGHSPKT